VRLRRVGGAGQRGFTLAELVMVVALISILAAVAVPTGRFMVKREREAELRLALRLMRNAIDEHKRLADQGMIQVDLGTEGYPKELEVLVEGVDIVGQTVKRKFLRRIPVDPMTGKAEWGLRSYQDEPDSRSWGGQNVYDVYSLSQATALDGSKYRDW
jgi:general secretion pathway protein G